MKRQKADEENTDRVLLTSRWDFLDTGFRVGLLEELASIAIQTEPDLIILAGGFTSHRGWKNLLDERIRQNIEVEGTKERKDRVRQLEVRKVSKEALLDETAERYARLIPKFFGRGGEPIKVYILLSPACSYDGPSGAEIAKRVERIRPDIILWSGSSGRFPLKKSGKYIGVLLPSKTGGVWRSKYFSTLADRIVEDKENQTARTSPALWVVGAGGVAVNRPSGALDTQIITVSALNVIERITSSENQVGLCLAEIRKGDLPNTVTVISLKDLTQKERSFIEIPETISEHQRKIIRALREAPLTIGLLEDRLGLNRDLLKREIDRFNKSGFEPKIVFGEESDLYDFDKLWIQEKLRYPVTELDKLNQHTLVAFGCLHAGYTKTQYRWFIRALARAIANHKVNTILGVGDFIAGLKHNLDRRGEVFAGLRTYTAQERFAAEIIAGAVLRSFRIRFRENLSAKKKGAALVSVAMLRKIVDESLVHIYTTVGNHDAWPEDDGHEPLAIFHASLAEQLTEGVRNYLANKGFEIGSLKSIVDSKLHTNILDDKLPSGTDLSLRHPRQGRMTTSSGRAQQTLNATTGIVVGIANFHTAIVVHQWKPESGQRIAVQCGTVASGTAFEMNMNKIVDTGMAVVTILTDRESGRIIMTKTTWYVPGKHELEAAPSDEEITNLLRERSGLKRKSF